MKSFREMSLALSDVVQIAILLVLAMTGMFIYGQATILSRNYSFEIVRDLRNDTNALHRELFSPDSLYDRLKDSPCVVDRASPLEIRFLTRSIFDHYRLYELAARQSMISESEWGEACAVGRELIRENCHLEKYWGSDVAPADDPVFLAEFNQCAPLTQSGQDIAR